MSVGPLIPIRPVNGSADARCAATQQQATIVSRPGRADIYMVAGDDLVIEVSLVDDKGHPIDLTGSTIRAHIRERPDAYEMLGQFMFCGVMENKLYLRITSDLSTDLPPSSVYDIEVMRDYDVLACPGPFLVTLLAGSIFIDQEVTRIPKVPPGPYSEVVMRDEPTCFYRLNDDGRNSLAIDMMGGPAGVYRGEVEFRAKNLLPGAVGASVNLNPSVGNTGNVLIPDSPATRLGDGPMSLEIWLRASVSPQGREMAIFNTGTNEGFSMAASSLMRGRFAGWRIFGTTSQPSMQSNLYGDSTALFTMIRTPTHVEYFLNNARVWNNGPNNAASGFGQVGINGVLLGGNDWAFITWTSSARSSAWSGQMQEFALYNYALSEQQRTDHYRAAWGEYPEGWT